MFEHSAAEMQAVLNHNTNGPMELPDGSEFSDHQVFIIRHGESTYNLACTENISLEIRDYTMNYLDAPLTIKGIKQCEKLDLHVPDLEVVLVSPLMRAMESAFHLFKNHPKFADITFILVPEMTESLVTTSDIPRPLE